MELRQTPDPRFLLKVRTNQRAVAAALIIWATRRVKRNRRPLHHAHVSRSLIEQVNKVVVWHRFSWGDKLSGESFGFPEQYGPGRSSPGAVIANRGRPGPLSLLQINSAPGTCGPDSGRKLFFAWLTLSASISRFEIVRTAQRAFAGRSDPFGRTCRGVVCETKSARATLCTGK